MQVHKVVVHNVDDGGSGSSDRGKLVNNFINPSKNYFEMTNITPCGIILSYV